MRRNNGEGAAVPDTRDRPRVGAMWISPEPLSTLFYDNWPVCPRCGVSERDGDVWEDFHRASYRCRNDHEFTWHTAVWEIAAR